MARSGSTDYSVTRNDIINQAFEFIGVLAAGEVLDANDQVIAIARLNQMVKRDVTQGLHLWGISQGTLFLAKDQESYSLGTGTADHATLSYVKTEVATAQVTGGMSVEVDSITGISAGDSVGVELDDGTIQWTTVDGVPVGTTVSLVDALTDDVAVDNHVYTYTTGLEKPVRLIPNTIRLENRDGTEIPVRLTSSSEYFLQVYKASSGHVNQCYYDRIYGDTGTLYVWPTSAVECMMLNFSFERMLQDFDAATDNPDYPIEATDYLVKNLAAQLAIPYGLPMDERQWLKAEAYEAKEDWLSFDSEQGSFYLQPERRF